MDSYDRLQILRPNAPGTAPTGDQVRAWRDKHGLTQREVANLLGKTDRSIKNHETDPRYPMPIHEWLLLLLLGGELTPAKGRSALHFPR